MKSLSKYVESNKVKLTQEEVKTLFNEKEINKEIIIKSQLPLVLNLSASFNATSGTPIEQLFSYAIEGILKAFETYDNTNVASFTTYAKKSIEWSLMDYKTHQTNVIKQPKKTLENNIDIGTARLFGDMLKDDDKFDVPDTSEIYNNNEVELIHLLKEHIKPNYIETIILYFGIGEDKPLTQKEVAKIKGVSTEAISQLLKKGLNEIKNNNKLKAKIKRYYE